MSASALLASAPCSLGTCAAHAQRVGRAAIAALYDELALEPKPGLVSFVDSGSHQDMDGAIFMRSLFALRNCFRRMAALGAMQATFGELEVLGIAEEQRMLKATGGINTHRGAVFTLGLLCAAAGALGQRATPGALRQMLLVRWGSALRERCDRSVISNGRRAVLRHGLRGACEEATLGFPALFECALPALQSSRARGLDDRQTHLQTLFTIIATLDDTNLAHRGGLAGLRFAQSQARAFLDAGGAARSEARAHARAIHAAFVARRLSPGGAADILAAACLVERVCQ